MKLYGKLIIIIVFVFESATIAFAQNEYSKWYFGSHASLDFMTSPPTPLFNNAMQTAEAASSIADASGNLLFYTNGVQVWNQQHVVMANGNGLLGNHSSMQGALIVKQPGNSNIYFIFTIDDLGEADGLRYSTVDMNLAAGMGSVTIKNMLLVTPSTEKLCGIRHCNGIDVWVVSHDYPGNTFRGILVSSAGVSNTPVLSSVGTIHANTASTMSSIKASPSGRKIGSGYSDATIFYYELFDFDNSTGVISNPVQINLPLIDAEFSPDGTKLYSVLDNLGSLCQLDLCAGDASAIAASAYTVACPLSLRLQKGIDGKIYLPQITNSNVGVINQPNNAGAACNYLPFAISASPNINSVSIPNFVTETIKIPIQLSFTNTPAGCNTASFSSSASCPLLNTNFSSIVWDFGDPLSGLNNISFLPEPLHTYPSAGTYTVKVVYYYSCTSDTAFQTVVIGSTPLSSSSQTICSGQIATLTASGNVTYTWSNGQNSPSILVSPVVNTVYTVQATSQTGCTNSNTVNIFVNPAPTLAVSGDTTGCQDEIIFLEASGALTYTWSNGIYSPSFSVSIPSTSVYTLSATNNSGCIGHKTIMIFVNTPPIISITGDATLCPGSLVTQTASGAITYSWSSGETTSSVSLSPQSNTSYTVIGIDTNGCVGKAFTTLHLIPPAILNVSPGRNVAPGSSATLSVTGGNNYTWTPSDYLSCVNCSNPVTRPANDIQYCVSSIVNGCRSEACIDITISCETGNEYSLPNAFSPNGDGMNDVFCLQGWDNCITTFEVIIFDRWGEKVFSSDNHAFCWDGIYKGKLLAPDVFVYVIKAIYSSAGKDKIISKKGNITLIQ